MCTFKAGGVGWGWGGRVHFYLGKVTLDYRIYIKKKETKERGEGVGVGVVAGGVGENEYMLRWKVIFLLLGGGGSFEKWTCNNVTLMHKLTMKFASYRIISYII